MTRVSDLHEEEQKEIHLRELSGDEVSPDWRPKPETSQAIWGEGKMEEAEQNVDMDCFTDAPEMEKGFRNEFRQEMASMSPLERGEWGEKAVVEEAEARGHRVISEHSESATTPGYDCVSWDSRFETLHVWEAKNYSWDDQAEKYGTVLSCGAWEAERVLPNVEKFLNELPPDDPERGAIMQALDKNRAEWHLRLGPDTDFAFVPHPPGAGMHDIRRYGYGYMLRVRPS